MAHEIIERIRALGPYLLIELFMPGGTLLALLLFAWRRKFAVARPREEANTRPMISVAPQGIFLAANP